ncbi:MAG: GNAT family N-acetyltransferase [Cellulomonas sp.]|nr:GNAT family N-acetyltransferase [Cellulomonas sp.]
MADLVIRVATADDVVAAGALTAEAYHSDRLIDDEDEYLAELLDAERRAREATVLVALVPVTTESPTSAVVGTITLAPAGSSYAEIAEPGEVEIRMPAVAPEARRRGVAEALTRAAMLEAVTLGVARVVLSTLGAMAAAQRLYVRLGFVARPERDWHHEGVLLRVYAWDVPAGPGIRVETAVWPPREVVGVGGWRAGVSGGFTRRANSVVALAEPEDVPASIEEVERIYAEVGLPPIFRVCAQSLPEDLDDHLRARGYRDVARTLVLVRAGLEAFVGPPVEPALGPVTYVLGDDPDDEWLTVWLADKATRPVDRALAGAVVTGGRSVFLSARDAGATVGVIRAAYEQDWVGLSCLTVTPEARRRSVGRGLTLEALRVAAGGGARHAFLQVQESNAAAIALYEVLGFTPAERYHYRQR